MTRTCLARCCVILLAHRDRLVRYRKKQQDTKGARRSLPDGCPSPNKSSLRFGRSHFQNRRLTLWNPSEIGDPLEIGNWKYSCFSAPDCSDPSLGFFPGESDPGVAYPRPLLAPPRRKVGWNLNEVFPRLKVTLNLRVTSKRRFRLGEGT